MKGITGLLTVFLFACAGGPEPHEPPPVAAQAECPLGFGPIGTLTDGCYQLQPTATTWVMGEEACEMFESDGATAHMLVIDRVEEHAAFSALSKQTGSIWLAMLQHDEDDDFRNINWIVWDQTFFGAGEPNDYGEDCDLLDCDGRPGIGDERCVEYRVETGMWNDKGCWRPSQIICEWDSLDPYGWRPGGST
jgi:hypothetical protein